MPTLVYKLGGRQNAFVFSLQDVPITIGRNPRCSVVVDLPGVSRTHAEISWDDLSETFLLRDLNSSNGTFLNGDRVSGVAALGDQDDILCGEFALSFRRGPRSGPQQTGLDPVREAGQRYTETLGGRARERLTTDEHRRVAPTGRGMPRLEPIATDGLADEGLGDAAEQSRRQVGEPTSDINDDVSLQLLRRIAELERRNAELAAELESMSESLADPLAPPGSASSRSQARTDPTIVPLGTELDPRQVPTGPHSTAPRDLARALFRELAALDQRRQTVLERLQGIIEQPADEVGSER